jgi:hypothetical protein
MKDHHEDKLSLLQQAKIIIIMSKCGRNSETVLLIPSLQASSNQQAPGKIKRWE